MMLLKAAYRSLYFSPSRGTFRGVKKNMDVLYDTLAKAIGGISTHISQLYSTATGTKQQFKVAVEGNIGSGKTCLLQHFAECPYAEVWTEPVSKWRDLDGHNALALMYKDPERWSMTLQTYVQLTMLEQHTRTQKMPVKLMERSLYSARYCFVENLYQSGKMPEIEYIVLTRWFDWLMKNENVDVDLIVYLRTTPETAHERIRKRCRKEEKTIPMDYLCALHDLHEDWLIHQTKFPLPAPVLVLDANKGQVEMVEQYQSHSNQILCGYS